jgi:uncharacterized protein (TIGR00369 family)
MSPKRTRTFTWNDPAACREAVRSMSGLDYLRASIEGKVPLPPISDFVDFQLRAVEPGRVMFELVPAEYHYNPLGVVHGGIISTILDSAAACAIQSRLPAGVGHTSIEIKVNFIRPVTVNTGLMVCKGRVINVGSRIATAEARLADKGGKLYAHAVTTCLIIES